MKQLTATAFEHANVAGKKLQYIRITNGKEDIIINVGMKTFGGVLRLQKEEEPNPEADSDLKALGNGIISTEQQQENPAIKRTRDK